MENSSDLNFGVEIPEYYQGYISKMNGVHFMDALQSQQKTTLLKMDEIAPEQWDYSYALGKWTVKELFIHLMDAERIFTYRALRFARNDKTELPGFEENDYVPASNAAVRTPPSIVSEYNAIRNSTIELFKNFTPDVLMRTGKANGVLFSVMLLGATIAGHEKHHIGILNDRYKL
jgi:hypothetical protein